MVKRRFARTNKRNYTSQLAAADVRERFMRRVEQRLTDRARLLQARGRRTHRQKRADGDMNEVDTVESPPDTSTRYNMAKTSKEWENLLEWIDTNRTDVATKV
jgi:hypothetical protein